MLRMVLVVACVRGTQYVMRKMDERRKEKEALNARMEKRIKEACEKAEQENNL